MERNAMLRPCTSWGDRGPHGLVEDRAQPDVKNRGEAFPLWVISGNGVTPASCPFSTQTFVSASGTSAKYQKRTLRRGRLHRRRAACNTQPADESLGSV